MAWYHYRYRGQQLCKNSARTVVSHEVASSVVETHTHTEVCRFSTSASRPWKPALTVSLYTRQNSSPAIGLHTPGLCDQATLATSSRGVRLFLPYQSQLPASLMQLNDYMCTHTTMDWWLSMVCLDLLSTCQTNHCELVILPHLKTDLFVNLLWTGREVACERAIRALTIGLTVIVNPLLASSKWRWPIYDHQRSRLTIILFLEVI